ncbi:hypothetical protein ACWEDF_32915, partial [Micromonospora chersina]
MRRTDMEGHGPVRFGPPLWTRYTQVTACSSIAASVRSASNLVSRVTEPPRKIVVRAVTNGALWCSGAVIRACSP